jgi:dCMP deaminase
MFMEIAQVVAKRATCFRENVGAIIVKDNKVISIGYNGPPSKAPHCKHHPEGKCARSLHAEENSIAFAGQQAVRSCDLYVTHLPCENCTQLILASQMFRRVFFQTMYGNAQPIYEALDNARGGPIPLLRVLPSGDITSHDRTELLDVKA